jgi:hypothetical protein
MTIQQLINDLQNAITVHKFDPKTHVQFDVLTYDGQNDNTYWNISVDASAISEPRSLAINAEEDES